MWTICHSLSNDFLEVSEQENTLKPKVHLPDFDILKNNIQFLLHPGFKQSKTRKIAIVEDFPISQNLTSGFLVSKFFPLPIFHESHC
jgi:hypothetical protein